MYIEFPIPYGIYDIRVTPYSPEEQEVLGTAIPIPGGRFALNDETPRVDLEVTLETFGEANIERLRNHPGRGRRYR